MNYNYINAKKREDKENPSFELDLSKYNYKPKKINVTYELRKKIANLVGKPILQIMGQTKGMTEQQLNGILKDAEAFSKNPGARCWNIIKEERKKLSPIAICK